MSEPDDPLELCELVDQLVDASILVRDDGRGGTEAVCMACDSVDGHAGVCYVPALIRWLLVDPSRRTALDI